MSEYPEDVVKAAEKAALTCFDGTTIKSKQGKLAIASAILAERERIQHARFEELQAAYRRGVDFACEGAGVGDEDYTELWRYVPKTAYDYADKATGPVTSPPSSAASSSVLPPSGREPDQRPCS